MATELYFDTARLGRMCTEARQAEQDFSKLASQLGSSLYWERFLVRGFDTLPAALRRRSAALSCWSGLTGLQQGLADFVSLPPDGSVILAGQSQTLITLAAESLFRKCRTVLTTDLAWPPYLAVLKQAAVRYGKSLHVLPVRQKVLAGKCDRRTLSKMIVSAYFKFNCEGLFLSDITHTGVRIPYEEVLRLIQHIQRPHFTVIDGAQALGQRPVQLDSGDVDLYLAGTQKWFGGYHPLRLAFIASQATDASGLMQSMLAKRLLSDPLATFCQSVSAGNWSPFGETVNLSALITAAGALAGWRESPHLIAKRWDNRRLNRHLALDAVAPFACSVVDESLTAGIALLRMNRINQASLKSRTSLREALGQQHIVASEPLRGFVRLAMPDSQLTAAKLNRLKQAFRKVMETQYPPGVRYCDGDDSRSIS